MTSVKLSKEEIAQKALGTLQSWWVIMTVKTLTHEPPAGLFQSWKEYKEDNIDIYVEALNKKSAQKKAEAFLATTHWMKGWKAEIETKWVKKISGLEERRTESHYDLRLESYDKSTK